jgi:hypothetical protein
VAVVEWTQRANPVSCNWVKQQGPAKGFDFDESKVEQIFDLLLREKQLKVPEGHKFPTSQELQGRPYCKCHHLFTHTTNDYKELCRQIQSMSEEQVRHVWYQRPLSAHLLKNMNTNIDSVASTNQKMKNMNTVLGRV